MAEPLTNVEEPGFYSEISVSPSLFLTPGSTQVVGLIGTGKSTKTVALNETRGTADYDLLASPISSINEASSTSVFHYPQSSFACAVAGTVDLSTLTYPAGPNGTLQVHVDGYANETVTITNPADAAGIVTQFNAGMTRVQAELDASNHLVIWVSGVGLDGKSLVVDGGSAATVIGFVAGTRANLLRWDPAVTDPNFAPQAGQVYQISYETPKTATDFAPQSFFTLRQVVAAYGDVSTSDSLSLGAQGAFGNGASVVVCRQLDPAAVTAGGTTYRDEIDAALTDMESQTISILVPMTAINDSDVPVASFLNHVSKMSSKLERAERTAILGVDEVSNGQPSRVPITGGTSWTSLMANFSVPANSGLEPKRIMVVNPGYCTTSYKGNAIVSDGTYLAACLAGLMCSALYDEAEPMTRKALSTVESLILPELTRSEKNALTSLGVTVIESSASNVLVRRAVTADGSSIPNQEPSIVRAFDRVARDLRKSLEQRFIGTKILGTTATTIEAATSGFLDTLINENIISAKHNIKAQQNASEPRQFDVSFEAAPIYPFIWGFIDISITLQ